MLYTSLIVVGIAWMLMGSPGLLKKRLNLNLNYVSVNIFKYMFYCGFANVIVGIVQMIFDLRYLLAFLPISISFLVLYTIRSTKRWHDALEVMDELERSWENES